MSAEVWLFIAGSFVGCIFSQVYDHNRWLARALLVIASTGAWTFIKAWGVA